MDSFLSSWGKHSRLIPIDIIGHGQNRSTDRSNRVSNEAAAKTLNLILDQLEIEKVDFFGYSMGGRLALTLQLQYPREFVSLF